MNFGAEPLSRWVPGRLPFRKVPGGTLLIGITLLSGCSKPATPPSHAYIPSVPMKNGRPLTPEQLREQQAYVTRAKAKKLARLQEAQRRVQIRILQAQARALDFQQRQASRLQRSAPPVSFAPAGGGAGFRSLPTPATAAPAISSPSRAEATVQNVRLIPWRTANGKAAQMVLTDWQNTGTLPIKSVYAEITAYDATGRVLDSGAPDYCIFAVEREAPAIQPGQSYHEPDDDGFILLSGFYGEASRVTVRILRAKP